MSVPIHNPIHLLKSAALLAALGTLQAQPSAPALDAMYGKLPLSFESNMGQTDASVNFLARGSGYNIMLTRTEAVLVLGRRKAMGSSERPTSGLVRRQSTESLEQTVVRMRMVGADPAAPMRGGLLLPGKANYFRGKDPARWRTDIPTYRQVLQPGVYPGIDLVYYGNQRQLEYDFVVGPGADPRQIRLAYDGVDGIEVEPGGDLLLHTPLGELRQHAPVIYQEIDGVVRNVAGAQVVTGRGEIAFEVRDYDTSRPLVIDPRLGYSTLLGGGGGDQAMALALDSSGNAYVCGWTTSFVTFPVTPSAFQRTSRANSDVEDPSDAFVSKMNPTGTALVYSTYLGGDAVQEAKAIAVDSAGSAYVAGWTVSFDFPTTLGAFRQESTDICCQDTFVTKLSPTGSTLVYSTFLYGSNHDDILAVAVDSSGNAYVTGATRSSDFHITTGAFQPTYGGGQWDAFVTKLNPSGSGLVYSTFIGGSGDEEGMSLAVDSTGSAYMAGYTTVVARFPATAGGYRSSSSGGTDAVVVKLNPAGSALVYSAALGGAGDDLPWAVAVDAQGNAYVAGQTTSTGFPVTQGAYQSTSRGSDDAFVSKLNPAGSSLVYSTVIGGSLADRAYGMALDSRGYVYLTGRTYSTDFPTTADAQKKTLSGSWDAFVCQLNDTSSSLLYSTYLGGSATETGNAIALDASGSAYIAGGTSSIDFQTTPGPYQMALLGGLDAYIVKITDFGGGGVTPPPVRTIAVVSGNNQSATVGTALPNPLIVEVKDGSTFVSGATVTFTATNATVNPSSVVTDAGRAQTVATMGNTVGPATITAATAGATSVTFTATALERPPQPTTITVVSAANGATGAMAPGMIVSIWGQGFATTSQGAPSLPLPTRLGNVSVKIQDSRGNSLDAPLFYVSPTQINVLIPDATQGGNATFSVTCSDGRVLSATVVIESVAPGVFTASGDGKGIAVGQAIRVKPDGSQTTAGLCRWDAGQRKWFGEPINMGSANDQTIIVLYGTGVRLRTSLVNVTARIGGQNAEVLFAGVQGDFAGLDQINLRLPRSVAQAGGGEVTISLTVDGKTANAVTITVTAVAPAPALSSISPTSSQSGQTVSNFTINGTNLSGGQVVWDNSAGVTLTGQTTTATSIKGTLTIAAGAAPGARWCWVVTDGGESNHLSFTIQPPPTPGLSSISPTTGEAGKSISSFTINGSNLAGGQVVWDNSAGLTLSGITTTATQVKGTLAIAADAAAGVRWLWIVTTAGESNHLPFTITIPAPTVSSKSGNSTVSPGESVTWKFTGVNLSAVDQMTCTPGAGITINSLTPSATEVNVAFRVDASAAQTKRTCTLSVAGATVSGSSYTLNVSTFRISNMRVTATNPGSTLTLHVTLDYTDPTGAVSAGTLSCSETLIYIFGITWSTWTINPTGRTPGAASGTMMYDSSFSNMRGTTGANYTITLTAPDGRTSDTISASF